MAPDVDIDALSVWHKYLVLLEICVKCPRLQLTLVRTKAFPSVSKKRWSSAPLKVLFKPSWMLGAVVDDAPLYWWPLVLMATAIFWIWRT